MQHYHLYNYGEIAVCTQGFVQQPPSLALQRQESKLVMYATGSLNQTAQCELMAWKHWENCALTDARRREHKGGGGETRAC